MSSKRLFAQIFFLRFPILETLLAIRGGKHHLLFDYKLWPKTKIFVYFQKRKRAVCVCVERDVFAAETRSKGASGQTENRKLPANIFTSYQL